MIERRMPAECVGGAFDGHREEVPEGLHLAHLFVESDSGETWAYGAAGMKTADGLREVLWPVCRVGKKGGLAK